MGVTFAPTKTVRDTSIRVHPVGASGRSPVQRADDKDMAISMNLVLAASSKTYLEHCNFQSRSVDDLETSF